MASIINASTSGAGGVITTADASGVLNIQTAGTTAIEVSASQIVAIGDTTASTLNGDRLFVAGSNALGNMTQVRTGVNTSGPILKHYKTRNTAANTQTAVLNGDSLGGHYQYASDGTSYVNSAQSQFFVEGSVSTGVVPTSYYMALANSSGALTAQFGVQSNGNLLFNSGYGTYAVAYGCRAWVNFNGTGTVAIRASGNVSSITDNGTGDYTINFTTAMPDANYSPAVSASANYGIDWPCTAINTKTASATEEAPTTTTFRLQCTNDNGSVYDAKYVTAVVFR